MTVFNLDADPNENWDKIKPGAKECVFLLGMVDLVPENHHNLSTMLEALGFPLPLPNIKFSADLKLLIIALGLQHTSSTTTVLTVLVIGSRRGMKKEIPLSGDNKMDAGGKDLGELPTTVSIGMRDGWQRLEKRRRGCLITCPASILHRTYLEKTMGILHSLSSSLLDLFMLVF